MSRADAITLLDGPTGTELQRRGVPTEGPAWSATALLTHPQTIAAIHRDYAAAGATVHTAVTFRVRQLPRWRDAAARAARIAREAVPAHHRIAGAIAPVGDCYEPWTWDPSLARAHRDLAEALAPSVDLLLCETFANPDEAVSATGSAAETGVEVWTALTAGPWATLLDPPTLRTAAERCLAAGATTVLVNCVAATRIAPYVDALQGLPFGVYANAGDPDEGLGFCEHPDVERYAALAMDWVEAGARVIGGCCGTRPAHVRALRRRLDACEPGTTG
ncbi:MAG: homocysteine S-methyltransferase family protein [Deltaproteobacteria bacterium]|nr:MAG: homocysteine S-methyltransferase family protein [Deltaproteobacteria bacterium]